MRYLTKYKNIRSIRDDDSDNRLRYQTMVDDGDEDDGDDVDADDDDDVDDE